MKINEIWLKPIKEVVEDMDIVKITPCVDGNGKVKKIIVEYVTQDYNYKEDK